MIKLTIKQLLAATEGNPSALQKFFQCPKPTTFSWTNRKLIASVNEEIRLYNEHRVETCKQYGVLDSKTNRFVFPSTEVEQQFGKEIAALQGQGIDLAGQPVKISDLGGHLSEIDLTLLEPFIVD
jgi:hypothetical protein